MNDHLDNELNAAQQEALLRLRGSAGLCPPSEDLVAFGELDLRRPEIERHLLTCAHCQELVDRLTAPEPSVGDGSWQRISQSLDSRLQPWRPSIPWYRKRTSLAMAAGLFLLLLLPALWVSQQPTVPQEAFRGSPIQQLEPSGSVARLEGFRWNAAPAALTYRVVVSDTRGKLLWSGETLSNRLLDLGNLSDRLEPGVPFRWKVEGVNQVGQVLAESDWLTFSVNP